MIITRNYYTDTNQIEEQAPVVDMVTSQALRGVRPSKKKWVTLDWTPLARI
jgi:hypothetical protein